MMRMFKKLFIFTIIQTLLLPGQYLAYSQVPSSPPENSTEVVDPSASSGSENTLFEEQGCGTGAVKQVTGADGKTTYVFDRQKQMNAGMMINLALAALSIYSSGKKLATTKCWSVALTPSYYMNHGAIIANGLVTILNVATNKTYSEELSKKVEAEAETEVGRSQAQIKVFEYAAEQTEKAAKAAKKEADIKKMIGLVKDLAIAAAVGEAIIMGMSIGTATFFCGSVPAIEAAMAGESQDAAADAVSSGKAQEMYNTLSDPESGVTELTHQGHTVTLGDNNQLLFTHPNPPEGITAPTTAVNWSGDGGWPESNTQAPTANFQMETSTSVNGAQSTVNNISINSAGEDSTQAQMTAGNTEMYDTLVAASENPDQDLNAVAGLFREEDAAVTRNNEGIGNRVQTAAGRTDVLAGAAMGMLKGYAASTVAQIVLRAVFEETFGVSMEYTPTGRAIWYGTQKLIAMALSKDVGDAAQCLDQRAKQYRSRAEQLKLSYGTDGSGEGDAGNPGTEIIDLNGAGGIIEPLTAGDLQGCMVRSSGEFRLDGNCSCRSSSSCFQMPAPNTNALNRAAAANGIALPPSLTTGARAANDFTNSIFSGGIGAGGTLAGSNGIQQSAFKLKSFKKKGEAAINQLRAKKGEDAINLDAESKKLYNKIHSKARSALAKAGFLNPDGSLNAKKVLESEDPKLAKEALEKSGVAAIDFNKKGGGNQQNTASGDSFDFLNNLDAQDNSKDTFTDPQENLKDLDISIVDNLGGKDEDIFNIISARYIRSGYPRLLEKEDDSK